MYEFPALTPRVSIVIPCYNGAGFVGRAIESGLARNHPDIEVIVVDDGSSDDSLAVICGYPAVTCIAQENAGVSATRNAGPARATGDFVIFLDCDDVLRSDCVPIGLASLRRHPQASFTFGRLQRIDAEGRPIPTQAGPGAGWLDYASGLHPRIPTPPALAMFRTTLVRDLGGFDARVRYGEDYEFYLRHLRRAPAWRHGTVVAEYRRHGANATRCRSAFLNGVMEVLKAERDWIGDDTALLAEWRAGRRDWQRCSARWLPDHALRRLSPGRCSRSIPGAAACDRGAGHA